MPGPVIAGTGGPDMKPHGRQISWARVLSVVIPTGAALIFGLWAGHDLARTHRTIEGHTYLHAMDEITAAARSGDTNAIHDAVMQARQNVHTGASAAVAADTNSAPAVIFLQDFSSLQLLIAKTNGVTSSTEKALETFFAVHPRIPVLSDTNALCEVQEVAYAYSEILQERGQTKRAVEMLEAILQTDLDADTEKRIKVEAAELYVILAEKSGGNEQRAYLDRVMELINQLRW